MQSGFFLNLLDGVPGGVRSGGERGLLGLAFHPGFDTNRYLFVYYTRSDGDIVVAELPGEHGQDEGSSLLVRTGPADRAQCGAEPQGRAAALRTGRVPLHLHRRRRRMEGDPFENGQNKNTMLGKTLRIAPDLNGGYSTPYEQPVRRIEAGTRRDTGQSGSATPGARASTARPTASGSRMSGKGSWERDQPGGRGRGWPQLRMGLPRRVPCVREQRLFPE